MSDLAKFTTSERFLREVMRDGANLADLIPDDAKDVLAKLRLCVGMGATISRWDGRSSLAIGRCLAVAHANPQIWRDAGYAKYSDFEKCEVEDKGVSHGKASGGRKAIEVFGHMPVESYVNGGGITNLVTAAYAMPKDASDGQKQEVLDRVKDPAAEFRPWLENRFSMAPGETKAAVLSIRGNQAQIDEVQEFLNSAAAQTWAGSKHPLDMLLAVIHNAISEIPNLDKSIPADHPALQDDPEKEW